MPDATTWRGNGIAIGGVQPELSPNRRFVVAGNVWLSNRIGLLNKIDRTHEGEELNDVQVVTRLWELHEERTLPMLEGMFAFAVWDGERRRLCLARDRVGACTLYYTTSGATRWIAPQLRTLATRVSPELDLVALRDYLCCAFVPGERTLWRDARELRPGTTLWLPGEQTHAYWKIQERITDVEESLDWHAQRLRHLLDQVVQEYLPDNAPVGAYLSGGLDSSLVVALAAKLHTHPVHTYSIHFGDECPNELEFSDLVARHCRTKHHVIEITPDQMWDLLPETMSFLDDPIGDPLTVPNLILGRAARNSADVILNGEGGDPCFGGPKNQPMLLTNLYQPALQFNAGADFDLISAYLASFQKCSLDLPRLLRPEVWSVVGPYPSVFEPQLNGGASYVNQLMIINTRFKGADHILTKVNNLTRAVGLHGRSPLFDQRVVEMSLRIPPQYKLSGAEEKAVLKSAVRDLLPEVILKRPKSGMMVPVQLWFRKRWRRRARALLLSRRARIRDYLNQDVIRDWLDYRGDTWSRYGVKLWLLVSLELWLRSHQPKLS
jgi:asparagine synthase (glutamine-hydrolysing)